MRLYFDTSVLGALTDAGDERPTVLTRRLLGEVLGGVHEAVISNVVQEEPEGIAPRRYRDDLRHVAVATIARVVAPVSWNFRHLVNLRMRRAIHAVNVRLGYPLLEIVSPTEV